MQACKRRLLASCRQTWRPTTRLLYRGAGRAWGAEDDGMAGDDDEVMRCTGRARHPRISKCNACPVLKANALIKT